MSMRRSINYATGFNPRSAEGLKYSCTFRTLYGHGAEYRCESEDLEAARAEAIRAAWQYMDEKAKEPWSDGQPCGTDILLSFTMSEETPQGTVSAARGEATEVPGAASLAAAVEEASRLKTDLLSRLVRSIDYLTAADGRSLSWSDEGVVSRAQRAWGGYPRAREPLEMWASAAAREDELLEGIEDPAEKLSARRELARLGGTDLASCATEDEYPDWMERRYWKHLHGFWCEDQAGAQAALGLRRLRRLIHAMEISGAASIEEIASRAGVSRETVEDIANGESSCGQEDLARVHAAVGGLMRGIRQGKISPRRAISST